MLLTEIFNALATVFTDEMRLWSMTYCFSCWVRIWYLPFREETLRLRLLFWLFWDLGILFCMIPLAMFQSWTTWMGVRFYFEELNGIVTFSLVWKSSLDFSLWEGSELKHSSHMLSSSFWSSLQIFTELNRFDPSELSSSRTPFCFFGIVNLKDLIIHSFSWFAHLITSFYFLEPIINSQSPSDLCLIISYHILSHLIMLQFIEHNKWKGQLLKPNRSVPKKVTSSLVNRWKNIRQQIAWVSSNSLIINTLIFCVPTILLIPQPQQL